MISCACCGVSIENPFLEPLTEAIESNDLEKFKEITNDAPRSCFQMLNKCGNTILQESIRFNRREIFDYIMSFIELSEIEIENNEEETALFVALRLGTMNREAHEYYASEIIKRGACVYCQYDDSNLLHYSIKFSTKITQVLLEKGLDVNEADECGNTLLHKAILRSYPVNTHELVAMLLMYGADPFFECMSNKKNSFELAIAYNRSYDIIELLFYYTFDRYREIHLDALVELAKKELPIFYEIFNVETKVIIKERDLYKGRLFKVFHELFALKCDYLDFLLKKYNLLLCELVDHLIYIHSGTILKPRSSTFLKHPQVLDKMNLFIESSPEMRDCMISYFGEVLNGRYIPPKIVEINAEENPCTELILFLLQNGMTGYNSLYHLIYTRFDYCELFRILLHLDLEHDRGLLNFERNLTATVIYDITLDLETITQKPAYYFERQGILDLLDYFADWKLCRLLLKYSRYDRDLLPEGGRARVKKHPRLPTLQELSRNVVRKHLVQCFRIKNTKDFYFLVNRLPISRVHKQIITFESKLY